MNHLLLFSIIVSCVTAHGQTDPAEEGPKIVAEAFGKLSGALSEAITSGGAAKALPVCSERAPKIASEVGKANGVVLRRASDKPSNLKDAADAVENAALEEFSLALSRKEAPTPKVIPNADGSTRFFSPILIGSSLCLQCHGISGTDIAPDTGEAIVRHYPADKATGYRLGELRGLWHVTFPSAASAEEASVKPGINEKFLDPNLKVDEWTEKFETESREIFHLRNEIVAAVGLKPGMAMADIGAGTGLFTLTFAEAVGEGGMVYAVEIASNFLEHIRARAARAKAANVETVLATERSVKLPESSIELAFICDVYHHFEYPQASLASLASLRRALKPGGVIVLIDFKRIAGESSDFVMGHVRAGQEVFESEIVAAGFEKVDEVTDLLEENYFVKFRRQ